MSRDCTYNTLAPFWQFESLLLIFIEIKGKQFVESVQSFMESRHVPYPVFEHSISAVWMTLVKWRTVLGKFQVQKIRLFGKNLNWCKFYLKTYLKFCRFNLLKKLINYRLILFPMIILCMLHICCLFLL